ncbi:hypothetical protein F5890DRAFT_557900 [Lentinula detonsa]|uniref:Secreted protein n=1 Tax=Lentinula detonsa TaxID=2804962 RepID=A0AA38Q7X6_9AGAR|nr:hypothetical protein F5890DRAFT_557900 [Lentinula detonsa]
MLLTRFLFLLLVFVSFIQLCSQPCVFNYLSCFRAINHVAYLKRSYSPYSCSCRSPSCLYLLSVSLTTANNDCLFWCRLFRNIRSNVYEPHPRRSIVKPMYIITSLYKSTPRPCVFM